MAPEVLLRPVGPDDAPAIVAVHLRARAAAPMPPAVHTDRQVAAWLSARLTLDEVWVADLDGQVVGYLRLTDTWLDDLYVLPSYAGQGIGSALLDLACSLRPAGFCLWVFEQNAPARAFYAHHGLVELERTDGRDNEERTPDLRVAWPGVEPLAFFRRLTDEVDVHLGDLLSRRAALTRAVQPLKSDPRRDPVREQDVVAAVARRAPALGEHRVARIMRAVIDESLDAAR